jgi:F0F1-type ATP synthase membrane subunit b/b'
MDGLSKLGIDLWSIGVYLANAGLMLFVLSYLLYKPVLGFMDRRRDEIRKSLDEARLLKDELDKKSEEASKAQSRFENELKEERESFRRKTKPIGS